jgi:hypothetical protein
MTTIVPMPMYIRHLLSGTFSERRPALPYTALVPTSGYPDISRPNGHRPAAGLRSLQESETT